MAHVNVYNPLSFDSNNWSQICMLFRYMDTLTHPQSNIHLKWCGYAEDSVAQVMAVVA